MTDLKWLEWLERQFGASLDMIETAIETATSEIWNDETDKPAFWHISYHVLFYVDFYLSTFNADLTNPAENYTLPEFMQKHAQKHGMDEPSDETITREEILAFLEFIRVQLRLYFSTDMELQFDQESGFEWLPMTKGELVLYNMRHIMEHTAVLNQILKKHGLPASSWKGLGEI